MADAASQVLLGSGLTVLSQPLMYVKVLVQVRAGMAGLRGGTGLGVGRSGTTACPSPLQVGYEPLPPTLGRNIFGRQVYQLPGLFSYGESAPVGPPRRCPGAAVGSPRG